jgi:hypothetical protein
MGMRYQQGIGVPQTLGVQPTLWKDPPSYTPKGFDLPSINAGTSRDYGDAGAYVDTKDSRMMKAGEAMSTRDVRLTVEGFATKWQDRKSRGSSPSITTPSTSRTMGRSSRGEVDPDERRGTWD